MSIAKSAKQAKADGRLLTREELAWFWNMPSSYIDQLRREGVLKPAFPATRNFKYHPSLAEGLPMESRKTRTKARSLTVGNKGGRKLLKQQEEQWRL